MKRKETSASKTQPRARAIFIIVPCYIAYLFVGILSGTQVAALQAQAEAAASRTVEAQVAVARLTKQMEQLQAQAAQAKEEANETKGEVAGVGRRMRSLMEVCGVVGVRICC